MIWITVEDVARASLAREDVYLARVSRQLVENYDPDNLVRIEFVPDPETGMVEIICTDVEAQRALAEMALGGQENL